MNIYHLNILFKDILQYWTINNEDDRDERDSDSDRFFLRFFVKGLEKVNGYFFSRLGSLNVQENQLISFGIVEDFNGIDGVTNVLVVLECDGLYQRPVPQ